MFCQIFNVGQNGQNLMTEIPNFFISVPKDNASARTRNSETLSHRFRSRRNVVELKNFRQKYQILSLRRSEISIRVMSILIALSIRFVPRTRLCATERATRTNLQITYSMDYQVTTLSQRGFTCRSNAYRCTNLQIAISRYINLQIARYPDICRSINCRGDGLVRRSTDCQIHKFHKLRENAQIHRLSVQLNLSLSFSLHFSFFLPVLYFTFLEDEELCILNTRQPIRKT